jgi:hypothetical protein
MGTLTSRGWGKSHGHEHHNLYTSQNIAWITKEGRMRNGTRSSSDILVGKSQMKGSLEKSRHFQENNI